MLVSTLFTPLWGTVMDVFISRVRSGGRTSCPLLRNSIHRTVLVVTITTGILRFCLQFFDNFDLLVIISSIAAFFVSPVVPTLDALLVYSLNNPELYGQYRLYGSLGFAAFVLIVALLVEIGEDSELVFPMWTCLILSVTSALLIFKAAFVEIAEIAVKDFELITHRNDRNCIAKRVNCCVRATLRKLSSGSFVSLYCYREL